MQQHDSPAPARTILAVLAIALVVGTTSAGTDPSFEDRVRERAAHDPEGRVDLILMYRGPQTSVDRADVESRGGSTKHEFRLIHGRAVRVPAQALKGLMNNPNVAGVTLDEPVHAMAYPESRPAPLLFGFPDLENLPYTGAGVTVAVVDSGMRSHPDLKPAASVAIVGKNEDKYGHGNHVAGLIAGNGSHSGGPYRGVAPGASIVSVRVLDDFGAGMTSDVIAGLDWVLQNKDQNGIRVVNVSLGHPVTESAAADPLVQAVEALWDAGVVVVCSAGNDGREGYGTITSPGNSLKVITVGSVTHWGDALRDNDIVSTFSSRGPTRYDHYVKPDLVTPGNRMISIKAKDSNLSKQYPEREIVAPGKATAEYFQMSGSSMSAAVVSGAVALMLEKDPTLDPDTVKARLMRSATKTAVGDLFATGAGVLDIAAALGETSHVFAAPSPRAVRDLGSGRMGFENTGTLWGATEWALAFVYSDAFVWSDGFVFTDAFVFSDAFVWSDTYSWSDAFIFSDGFAFSDAFAWSDAFAFSDASVWSDAFVFADDTTTSDRSLTDD